MAITIRIVSEYHIEHKHVTVTTLFIILCIVKLTHFGLSFDIILTEVHIKFG